MQNEKLSRHKHKNVIRIYIKKLCNIYTRIIYTFYLFLVEFT